MKKSGQHQYNELRMSMYSLGPPRWLSGKRICLPTQEMLDCSLGWEDPLEEELAALSRILTWRIPWTEKPGGLQFMALKREGHN